MDVVLRLSVVVQPVATAIACGINCLALNPEIQQKLRLEIRGAMHEVKLESNVNCVMYKLNLTEQTADAICWAPYNRVTWI